MDGRPATAVSTKAGQPEGRRFESAQVELTSHFANPPVNLMTWTFPPMLKDSFSNRKISDLDARQLERPSVRRKRHLTDEQTKTLVEDYRSGLSANQLAESYGVHRTTLSSILKKERVALRFQSLSREDLALAVELYEAGLSLAKIAHRLGRYSNTICSALKAEGVQMRDCQGRNRR